MARYQTRPVVVEAVQFTPEADASSLGIKKHPENRPRPMDGSWGRLGTVTVWINDWVVMKNGERQVHRPGDFEATYEEAPA